MLTIFTSLTAAATSLRNPLALHLTARCARPPSANPEGGGSFSLKVHSPIQATESRCPFSASQSACSITDGIYLVHGTLLVYMEHEEILRYLLGA